MCVRVVIPPRKTLDFFLFVFCSKSNNYSLNVGKLSISGSKSPPEKTGKKTKMVEED
jgi:hypothetical protein